jgi:hypothetical protein
MYTQLHTVTYSYIQTHVHMYRCTHSYIQLHIVTHRHMYTCTDVEGMMSQLVVVFTVLIVFIVSAAASSSSVHSVYSEGSLTKLLYWGQVRARARVNLKINVSDSITSDYESNDDP